MHCRLQCSNSTRRRRRFSALGARSAAATVAASCLAALTLANPGDHHSVSAAAAAAFLIAGSRPQVHLGCGLGGDIRVLRRKLRAGPETRACGVPGARQSLLDKSLWVCGARHRPWQEGKRVAASPVPAASGGRFGSGVSSEGRVLMSAPAADTGGGDGGFKAATENSGEQHHHAVGGRIAFATAAVEHDETTKGEVAAAAPQGQELAKMKLTELKALYRDSGGKPGTLRKAELMERLKRSFEGQAGMGAEAGSGAPPQQAPVLRPSPAALTGVGSPRKVSQEVVGVEDFLLDTVSETYTAPAPATEEAGISPFAGRNFKAWVRGDGQDVDAAGMSPAKAFVSWEPEQRVEPAPVYGGSATFPLPGDLQATSGLLVGQGFAEVRKGNDVLSQGPAAVVAAARARGVAAAAAVTRGAAGSRLRAMEEARRHTEAAHSRAVKEAWARSPSEVRRSQEDLSIGEGGSSENRVDIPLLDRGGLASAAEKVASAAPRASFATAAQSAPVAPPSEVVSKPPKRSDSAAPENHAVAGVPAGAACNTAPEGAKVRSASWSGYRGQAPREPERRTNSAALTRGREAQTSPAAEGRDGIRGLRKPREEGSTAEPRFYGRPRLMPKMPNPWARGGKAGGSAEGLPEDGDVVDEYLEDMMMQASDRERCSSGDPLFDREKRLEALPGASMQLHFLGTASCIPSTSRGVSCTVLRNEGELWMFDVGEGTQVQIQRSPIKPTRITKIFITHAHGDHSFGLPGMLCLMGQNYERIPGKRVEIYGPTGLRAYLRAALRYTYSKVTVPYVVHELKDVPHLHGDVVKRPEDFHLDIDQDSRFGEQRGGRDIYPDRNGVFEVFRDDKAIIRAAPMKHGVPCVGYCVEEPERPGRLRIEHVSPILNDHKEVIQEATGKKGVGWILGSLKAMKPGDSLTLPGTDGITIHSDDAVEPPTKGRKVVILGDTCDASSMVPLAEGADVVVHEATNAFLPPLDQGKTYVDVEREAIEHGHSTPVMAAAFADRVGAKTLVLNHFSARYRGDASDASVAAMLKIEHQAMRAGALERHQVIAAWDLLQLPVLSADQWDAHRAKAREEDEADAKALLERAAMWKGTRERQQQLVENSAGSPPSSEAAVDCGAILGSNDAAREREHGGEDSSTLGGDYVAVGSSSGQAPRGRSHLNLGPSGGKSPLESISRNGAVGDFGSPSPSESTPAEDRVTETTRGALPAGGDILLDGVDASCDGSRIR